MTGLTSHTAVTVSEAVDQLEAHPGIALAVIDADLPGTGAFPLILFFRQKRPVSFPNILVSTFSLPILYLALKTGCTELLSKPYPNEIIKAIVNKWIKDIPSNQLA